jgi:hypothetical protein
MGAVQVAAALHAFPAGKEISVGQLVIIGFVVSVTETLKEQVEELP